MIFRFNSDELIEKLNEYKHLNPIRIVQPVQSVVLHDGRIAEIQIVITVRQEDQVLESDILRIENDEG